MLNKIIVVKKEDYNGEPMISYQSENIKDYRGVGGERALSHSFLMDSYRKIMGKTLTIIDASIGEPKQNKAIKDLVRAVFSDEMEFSAQWAFDQDEIQKMIEGQEPIGGSVTIEEVLGVK